MNRPVPLIGLTGPARSGKSTVAQILRGHFNIAEVSFAAPIRKFVADLLGWTLDELERHKEEVVPWLGQSPRRMMQTLGTEWGRELVKESLWTDAAMKKVENLAMAGTPTVISDVRFENEARAIREAGGIVAHIVRPSAVKVESHASEAGIVQHAADWVILNDQGPAELQRKVLEFARGWGL